ncbi:ATP-binding protein [Polyangium aurulentum]|uniref:ATP-binding protein n=1 Tax=Polyangium aurulentum TaxID=2567896 RepID=UPI0010AECC76|nr:ATP-binding protein [Polyangium aurulentum]UQA56836.1 response regulator [Polyangium aurulentum]
MPSIRSHESQPPVATLGDDALFAGRGEMPARMQAMAWDETPLGAPLHWPQSLRSALSICLGSAFPIAIYWGEKLALLYNDAWSPIPGGKHPWALGRPGHEVWPEIWDTIGPMFEQVLSTGEATYSEDQLLPMRRHGYTEECYFNFTFSPIRGEGGRVEGIFNAVIETTFRVISERRTRLLRDLGERTATARSAEEACALAATTLGEAPRDVPFCALYLADDKTHVARLAACSGIAPGGPAAPTTIALEGEADGAPWPLARIRNTGRSDIVTGLDERFGSALPGGPWPEPANAALVAPILAGSGGRAGAFLVLGMSPRLAADDEYRQFAERAASQIGSALGTAMAYEIERKRAESLAELDRAKTAFFSNVSHEFRTPLTLMLGPAEEAISSPDRALRGPDLETVHRNALRLLKLVNTLLDFSRIEAGRAQVAFERTDIAMLTRDLASAFRSAIERGGVELVVDCSAVREPVYVDRTMWEKIVLNLLSNAFKFTFEGKILVTLREVGRRFELSVADTGVGIPEHELPRVFERFHRIEGTRSRTHEGSGIGLALVHDLVRLHGGSIEVSSGLHKGTTFRVSIPTGSAHLPADRVGEGATAGGATQAVASFVAEAERWLPDTVEQDAEEDAAPGPAPSSELVLVADDNADMREYIVRLLGKRWSVLAVADGAQALEVARARHVDLILTDVMMPNLDGFGLIRALRANGATSRIPVIMLSARAGEESRIEGLQAGADDYLVKPFSSKELVARVSTHLELARARRQAEAERNRFESLLKDVPAAVNYLRGPDLVFEFAHPITTQALGGRAIEGKQILEAIPEHRGQAFEGLLREVLATGRPQMGSEVLIKLDKTNTGALEDTYWNFTYLPVRSVTGEIEGVMTFDLEVTDQVLARRRIEGLMEELKATDRRKDEFLAMLAHELRNPLAPIQTSLYLLRKRAASPELDRYLDIVERQAHNLARIVDDLLDVSRITRGKIELRKERFDLAKAVSRALESSRELIESRKHAVTVSLPDRPVPIEADPVRLDQIVINLITNAAKYTDKGGQISVSLESIGDTAELRVRDNGIGIPPDLLPRVFELFQQGGRDLARSQGGLGIGLTVVRRLIELHGGTVEARSEGAGKGSEFIVRIPRVREEPASPSKDGADGSGRRAMKRAGASRARVLVVDDNQDAAQSLAEVIEQYGHEARVAIDGVSALKIADEWQPQLVFLDIGLPGMDGYQVAQALGQRSTYKPVLVALTGYGQESDRRASNEAGFTHHLVKPAQIRAVEEVLETLDAGR